MNQMKLPIPVPGETGMERARSSLVQAALRFGPLVAGVVLATGIVISAHWLIARLNAEHAQDARDKVTRDLHEHRDTLESALNRRLSSVNSLAAFASSSVYTLDQTFEPFARRLTQYGGRVRSLQLARNAVVSHVYPASEGGSALGRDLLTDPRLKAHARSAYDRKGLVVSEPILQSDGSLVITAILPVTLKVPHESAQSVTKNVVWGLALVQIDVLSIFEDANMIAEGDPIRYAIRDSTPGASLQTAFWGDNALFETDSVRSLVEFPSGAWTLAASPADGWPGDIPYYNTYRAGALAIGLLVFLISLALSVQLSRIQTAAEIRNRSLRDAEGRMRTFFQSASEAVILMDSEGRFQDVNPAFADILGYELPALKNRGLRDFTAPEQDIRTVNLLLQAWRMGRSAGECVLRRRDGLDVQVEMSLAKLEAARGQPILMAIGHDITERKTREDILVRHSRELEVRDAISSAISGTTDVNEIMRLGVSRARKFLEYDLGQIYLLIRKDPARLEWAISEGADDALVAASKETGFYLGQGLPGRVLESKHPVHIVDVRYEENFPRRSASRECGYQSAIAVPLMSRGEVIGIMEFYSHQRKAVSDSDTSLLSSIGELLGVALENARLYEKIRASEADFRSLFENSVEGIYRSTMSGQFLIVNPALAKMLGYESVDAVLSLDMATQVYSTPLQRTRILEATRETDIIQGLEFKWRRKDGTLLDVRYNGRKVRDSKGAFLYFEGFVEDLTERNRMQSELMQTQKMETIGTMAGGIAHDFNNQLTVILGNLDLCLLELAPDSGLSENLQNASKAARRCAELTRSILTFGRQMTSEPRPMNLNSAVDESTRLLERSFPANIRLDIQKLGNLWTISADPTQMQQVLMNLSVNARDAMPGGGALTIRTSNLTLTEEDCFQNVNARPGRFVCLSVQDTGAGIPPEILPRIFEPFFTTKEVGKGTGLGLAMVYGIVKAHNGWVNVSSSEGVGTTFTIYLPVVDVAVAEERPASVSAPRGNETILVVDDEELVLGLARSILERNGYRVEIACDGVEAVELFKARAPRIDAIILDLNMPRMTGLEAIEPLRRIRADVPIIISSGYRADGEARSAIENGAAGFIQKPYTPAVMAQAVRKVLDEWKIRGSAGQVRPSPPVKN